MGRAVGLVTRQPIDMKLWIDWPSFDARSHQSHTGGRVPVMRKLRPDFDIYIALVGKIRGSTTAEELEALVPEVVSCGGGAYREELARTWRQTWKHNFPDREPNLALWPPA